MHKYPVFLLVWLPHALAAQINRNDTTYYFWYNAPAVSAKITPWQNGHRNIYVYDQAGNRTLILSDHTNQDTCVTDLEFNENGSVKIAYSRYHNHEETWYSIVQTEFTNENQPVRRMIRHFPEGQGQMNESFYWDTELSGWVSERQELIGPPPKEEPVPDPSEYELPTNLPDKKKVRKKK